MENKLIISCLLIFTSCLATLIALATKDAIIISKRDFKISRGGWWLISIAFLASSLQLIISYIEDQLENENDRKMSLQFQNQINRLEEITDCVLEVQNEQQKAKENEKIMFDKNLKKFSNVLDSQEKLFQKQSEFPNLFEPYYPFSLNVIMEFNTSKLKSGDEQNIEFLAHKEFLAAYGNSISSNYLDPNGIPKKYFEFINRTSLILKASKISKKEKNLIINSTQNNLENFIKYDFSVKSTRNAKENGITRVEYNDGIYTVFYSINLFDNLSSSKNILCFDDFKNSIIQLHFRNISDYFKVKVISFDFPPNFKRTIVISDSKHIINSSKNGYPLTTIMFED